MKNLIVHPHNEEQLKVIKAFFQALHISFEQEKNDTSYIMSSKKMLKRLKSSQKGIEKGEGIKVNLDELWK